jgi:predicted phage tail component-like protein
MKYGYGFTFRDRHSSEFSVVAKSDDRSLLPEKRRNEFIIPGRDGAADFGGNTYEKRTISVTLGIVSRNLEELRTLARVAAKWLSGEGLLIFDDEPGKAYRAKIYQPLSLNNLVTFGETSVPFECAPFAESPLYNQITESFTDKPHSTRVAPSGTQDTPCIIYIKNIGTTNVSDIVITRKAGV